MGSIAASTRINLFSLIAGLQRELATCSVLEDAAQKCTEAFYKEFKDSLALTRVYVTVPYSQLPAPNQRFVEDLAQSKQLAVRPNTPVLSLVATSGSKAEWNNRRSSQGHVGIPLVSSDFADSIPMVSRLLKDLSAELSWLDLPEPGLNAVKSDFSSLFHVLDAKTTIDSRNRKIIPAQDFVDEQSVKTVFGVGGSYSTGALFAILFFTREELTKESAERFMPVCTTFKSATTPMITSNQIFRTN